MSRLGAILAGGHAHRFGGDKAAATIGGVPLIERVAAALRTQCDALVVVGRDWPGLIRIDDRPGPGLGPLGGLAGALAHAGATRFDQVLTSGCDLPDVPLDLAAHLAPAPAVIWGQPLLGLWPTRQQMELLDFIARDERRALRDWIRVAGARQVAAPHAIANINTRADLAAYRLTRAK